MPITVSIVEDDRKTRESMVALLRYASGVRLLGAHPSSEAALVNVPAEQPEVVLMDINLPGMSGIDCIAKLKTQMPGLRVLMLTTYEDSHLIFNSLRAGASGYILKNKSSAELLAAIQQVHEAESRCIFQPASGTGSRSGAFKRARGPGACGPGQRTALQGNRQSAQDQREYGANLYQTHLRKAACEFPHGSRGEVPRQSARRRLIGCRSSVAG